MKDARKLFCGEFVTVEKCEIVHFFSICSLQQSSFFSSSDDANRRISHKAISDHDGGDCMSDDGLTTSEPIWLPSSSSRASHSVHSSPMYVKLCCFTTLDKSGEA